MKSEDFDRVKVIGRGAFGEVQLVSTDPMNSWQFTLLAFIVALLSGVIMDFLEIQFIFEIFIYIANNNINHLMVLNAKVWTWIRNETNFCFGACLVLSCSSLVFLRFSFLLKTDFEPLLPLATPGFLFGMVTMVMVVSTAAWQHEGSWFESPAWVGPFCAYFLRYSHSPKKCVLG